MMTQMAPMLEMMKAKMGKRRFAMMMQTMGPMMSRMMENGGGGFGGMRAAVGRHPGVGSAAADGGGIPGGSAAWLWRKATAWAWAAATSWACSAAKAAAR